MAFRLERIQKPVAHNLWAVGGYPQGFTPTRVTGGMVADMLTRGSMRGSFVPGPWVGGFGPALPFHRPPAACFVRQLRCVRSKPTPSAPPPTAQPRHLKCSLECGPPRCAATDLYPSIPLLLTRHSTPLHPSPSPSPSAPCQPFPSPSAATPHLSVQI